ncbi:MAG: hypothetical protein C0467_22160 [Planctomycetaceae bacterium]|nr:hypothetical protein [Planctomycetaceae bacterium]
MQRGLMAGLLLAVLMTGCGGGSDEGHLATTGTVTVNGQPVANVVVTYIPQGTTGGNGGTATTDSSGRYEIVPTHGKSLPPGQYKVTVSRRLNPDGSPPDPNVPPMESSARETLPAKYTDADKTELNVTLVAGEKKPNDFAVKSLKK